MEATLLAMSRDAERLARLLTAALPPSARKRATQSAGLPPYVGTSGPRRMAADLGKSPRLLAAVADALAEALPAGGGAAADGAPGGDAAEDDEPAQAGELPADAPREAVLAALRAALESDAGEGADRASALLETHGEGLRPARERGGRTASGGKSGARGGRSGPAPEAGRASGAARPAARSRGAADGLKEAKAQLAAARREKSELERKLAAERKAVARLERELAAADAKRATAEQRAADAKKQLADARSVSQREQQLEKRAGKAERERGIAEQKLALTAEERDDLRAQLEDQQRFAALADEEVPSFRDKPLLPLERDLGAALAEHAWAPRILVVGGGEPQRRHLEKFAEYAEAVGFAGEWRLADYVSWHKAIDKLREDMQKRFDALVILHWNRTTFTRKAREACNDAGQKPCVTCHYEGFTSLRETLQETLRQLLAARGPAS